jgi:hypothetical protein
MRLRTKLLLTAGDAVAGAGSVKLVQTLRDKQKIVRHTRTAGELIDRECRVTTTEVSDHFGQGVLDDGGPGMILSIRCDGPNDLGRGDMVRIVSYHSGSDTYLVESFASQDADAEETAA